MNMWGVRFADLIYVFLISHENEIIWSHFHRIFENGGGGGGSSEPLEYNPPLLSHRRAVKAKTTCASAQSSKGLSIHV